jgi:hypothetical protein
MNINNYRKISIIFSLANDSKQGIVKSQGERWGVNIVSGKPMLTVGGLRFSQQSALLKIGQKVYRKI